MLRAACLSLAVAILAFGDMIVMKDGRKYKGTFLDADPQEVRFRTGGRIQNFPTAGIAQLQIGDKPAPDRSGKSREPAPAAAPAPPPAPEPPALTMPEVGANKTTPIQGAGAIDSEFTRMGGEAGTLGPPRAPVQDTRDHRATVRFFQNGAIYWTPNGGAHAIYGNILEAWTALGGEASKLGYPVGDEDVQHDGFNRRQAFEHGVITWTPRDGAKVQVGPQ